MKSIKGNSFGVRFYRRTLPKGARVTKESLVVSNQDAPKPPAEADIYSTVPLRNFYLGPSLAVMTDIPDQIMPPFSPSEKPHSPPPDDNNREKLLWQAARSGDCHKIRVLVMQGADLDARDAQGRTALNIASQYSQRDALKTLLAAKEMRRMASVGDLPDSNFFRKFDRRKTGSEDV